MLYFRSGPKASIGYTYQNSTIVMGEDESAESGEDESDSDLDIGNHGILS